MLPPGWRGRLVTHAPSDCNGHAALCPEPHDLWLSKAVAGRPKDWDYCREMAAQGMVDANVLDERLALMTDLPEAVTALVQARIAELKRASDSVLPTFDHRLP